MDDTEIANDLVYPKSWIERAEGVPQMPGPLDMWTGQLRSLLYQIDRYDGSGGEIEWPNGQTTKISEAARRATRCGLLERPGRGALPNVTADGYQWLRSESPELLIEIFHRHVRFVGELLSELADGPKTHEELLKVAKVQFGMAWKTDTPVRARTAWLRAAAMVDLFEGRVHITDRGAAVLSRLVLGAPDHLKVEHVDFPTLVPSIKAATSCITDESLGERTVASQLYVPGEQDNGGRIEALRTLVESAISPVSADEFNYICQTNFGCKPSSGVTARDSLRAMGLLSRIARDEWKATDLACSWIEEGGDVDLAFIIHMSLYYFGEIVQTLVDNGEMTANQLVDVSAACPPLFKRFTNQSISSRLQLLQACGLIFKVTFKSYAASSLGKEFCKRARILPTVDSTQIQLKSATEPLNSDQVASVLPGQRKADEIAKRLEETAFDSKNPDSFEHAVIDALNYVGLAASHRGGNGVADGSARTGVGAHGSWIAVEAKSAGNGVVTESQANLLRLPGHREQLAAEVTLLIGNDFETHLLAAIDNDPCIAGVFARTLAEAVRRQQDTPLSPDQLSLLSSPEVAAHDREGVLEQIWDMEQRRAAVERAVFEVILEETEVDMGEESSLDSTVILRLLRRHEMFRKGNQALPEKEEVEAALAFLSHPRISAVVCNSEQGYSAAMPLQTVQQRMGSFERQWGSLERN